MSDDGRYLPRPVRFLLRAISRLVPAVQRDRWLREWSGELAWARSRDLSRTALLGRSLGSVRDAFWIRTHEWSPEMLVQDLSFAARSHLKRPGFALVALLTLAIGIGGTTALFSLINGVLLSPLPYEQPERLVRLYGFNAERGISRINVNPMDIVDVGEQAETLSGVALETGGSVTLTELAEPVRIARFSVSSGYFDLLGARPLHGRFFRPGEDAPDAPGVVVLAESTWRRWFGADPEVVGETLRISGESHTIVGVAPDSLRSPLLAVPPEIWMPLSIDAANRGGHFARAIARMAPGADMAAVADEVASIASWLSQEYGKPGRGIEVVPLQESVVAEARPVLLMLFGAVAFVLATVCANLAGLQLARTSGRRREMAVRVALGASRVRILRQLLSESVMLSLAGGLLGVGLAAVLTMTAGRWLASALPTAPDVALDARVLLFALVVSVLAGVTFGMAPAWQALRRDLSSLQDGVGAAPRHATALRSGLVVAEVALSLVLLVGAGLMGRSFVTLMAVETGYDPTGLLTARLSATADDYPDYETVVDFYDRLGEELSALPAVAATGRVNRLPLGGSQSCDGFHLEGWEPAPPGEWECAEERVVGGDYFESMGIRLIAGRWFDDRDGADGEPVVVVSQTMAERYLSDRDPIGAGFKWGGHDDRPYRRVIGVVEDVRHSALDAPPLPEVYMPQAQYPYYRTMFLTARTEGDASSALGGVRAALRQVDPRIPLFDVATMRERLGESVLGRRMTLVALGGFATVALLLAAIGLYGVLAYTVVQRTREIGIRIALGASVREVRRMVLRRGLLLSGIGIAIGLVGWLVVSRGVSALLFGVAPTDPVTLAATAVGLLAIAAAASYLPALRATRVDPVVALRE